VPAAHGAAAAELVVSGQAMPAGQTRQAASVLLASAKVPGAHAALAEPSALGHTKPAGQGVQAAAPPRLKEPGAAQRCAAPGAAVWLAQANCAGQGVQAEALPRL
jgi:hypothetical protein